ncbi:hypothetical protein [Cellvibrio sp. QJXJ]|uniref:hypothetical protein n=1 Tax=Cellvibrio sp. QJXJ TaxID=2964606 RepID=UPI0021C2582F|nr:hypothetical protein [Cellvibrio sp. QJXJ]UUA71737.1 hypothetical protein NNX04_15085 [Cellvibrio sp. QJXJ]
MPSGVIMQPKNSFKLLVVALTIAMVSYVAFTGLKQSKLSSQAIPSANHNSDLPPNPPLEKISPLSVPKIATQFETFFGDPADAAEITKWYAERGKFISAEGESEYISYNQETLEKLAESGDIRAMQMLAKIYMDREHFERYGFDAAKKQYWNAAVHGSTEALIALATLEKTTVYDLATDEADKKSKALEVLALYKAVELRGDLWSPENQVPTFKEMNRITLSEAELAAVDQRARQIYSHLQQQRSEMGLGDFDDSMPESVKKFFEKIKNHNK